MIIELRVKQPGIKWGDIPPVRADIGTEARTTRQWAKNADIIAVAIAKGEKQEVRWNFEGSLQGHYTGGW